jgi:DNA-binding transcriptional regulator YiaG
MIRLAVLNTRISVHSHPNATEARRFSEFLRAAIFSLQRSRGKAVTQKQFAEEIGVTYRTLQDWLNEQSTPKPASAVLRLMCTVPDQEERLRLLEVWLGEATQ